MKTFLNAVLILLGALAVASLMSVWVRLPRPTILSNQTVQVGDERRTYRLVLPSKYPGENLPLVFAFHGTGDTPDAMAAYSNLDQAAAYHGFILAYPEARRGMWATTDIDPQNLDQNADVMLFDQLLETLVAEYRIDRTRVYAMGMSNGATFVQLLAFARPHRIAAVAAHSGPKPRELDACETKFPIVVVVGGQDAAYEAVWSDWRRYDALGHPVSWLSRRALGHQWSVHHNSDIWRILTQYQLANPE